MKKWKQVAVLLSSLMAMSVLLPASSAQAAANSVTPFVISYGNTELKGELSWYNRSVGFEGVNTVASGSGCRQGWFRAGNGVIHDYGSTSMRCVAGAWPFAGTLTIDQPGGAEYVDISYFEAASSTSDLRLIGGLHCTPSGCVH